MPHYSQFKTTLSTKHQPATPATPATMFSTKTVTILACAAITSAIPMPPAGSCVVDLNGTPYNQLALRPTPCNDQPTLAMLNNGQSVVMLSPKQQSGCGFTYTYVQYTAPNGKTTKGWLGSDFIDCHSQPTSQISCGSFSVSKGGPTNACGAGKSYTASDSTMCNADGSNCVAQCCTNLVYRRSARAVTKCGAWSVKKGGPANACGDGFEYTADSDDVCSGKNCKSVCCSPKDDDTVSCGKWSVTKGGPANACGSDKSYTASDSDVCDKDGSDCVDQCCTSLVF